MTIRRLVPSDVAAYRALMIEAYDRHPDAFTSSASERAALPLSWWQARLAADDASAETVFGAFDDDRLVGVAGLAFEKRAKVRHKATLFGMYVLPVARGRGAGEALVRAALAFARSRGIKIVQLTVTQGNAAAESLYRRCGFDAFGLEPYAVAIGDEYASKVHMWCDVAER